MTYKTRYVKNMIPKIEWCNWVFSCTDNMYRDRWMVKRDCCDDDKLRMHDYVLVVYPDAETGNKINIVCQIVEMCGVGLPALRALETGDRTSIMGAYITNCRLVRIKKPEEKQS